MYACEGPERRVTSRAGRGARAAEAEGVVHMRRPPRLKVTSRDSTSKCSVPPVRVLYSFHFCTTTRSPVPVSERGYHCNLCARGIYDSTLWTPTLLVHHLLSQSSRLTRRIDMRQARDIIREECEVFHMSDKQIREIMTRLHNDLAKGLGKDTHANAIVKCWLTYIQDLPNGKERGKFLALDLGGTNFRVLIINLGENHFDMQSKIYAIPNHIMTGTGVALFDHIAECLANFMKEHNVYAERLPLGFTFSFPLKQEGLTKGILQRWTKGFSCSGVIDENVVQCLKDAIARRGDVQIDICAILNDTTGTLMSCAWKNHNCKIGLIVGTGSNACYVEKTENCELFDGEPGKPDMLINTEWGAFGDDGNLDLVRTEFDRDVDTNSINPGKQIQEKMISGMYMGELVRLALVKFTKMGLLFGGRGSDLLFQRGSFYTKYVSEIESDKQGDFTSCMEVLEELGLSHATEADMAAVRHVCECVSRRAAHLVSAGIATMLNKMDEPRVTVGIDGSVYRFHPHFHALMCEKIAQLVRPGIQFDLMLSEDGSGRGAALVAAVACRQRLQAA